MAVLRTGPTQCARGPNNSTSHDRLPITLSGYLQIRLLWGPCLHCLCRLSVKCDDRPADCPNNGGIQQHSTTLHAHAYHPYQNHQLPNYSTNRERSQCLHSTLRAIARKHLQQNHCHRCTAAPAETPSPPPDTTTNIMASSTGNNGWAQLRQQARSLESQVSSHRTVQLGCCS